MSGRLPRALARRIDRLSRRAHAFHAFAHHPLCAPYEGEVLRAGRRVRICRGCTLVAAGAAAGLLAGALLPSPPAALPLAAAAALALAAPAAVSRRGGRPRPKLLTRFAPVLVAAWSAASGLRTGSLTGATAAALAVAVVAAAIVLYRRRGPDRTACAACPEPRAGNVCSGFREIARRERAFRRLAGRWIDAGG